VLRPDLVLVFLWYSICRNLLSLVVHSGPFLTLGRCHAFLSEMLNQDRFFFCCSARLPRTRPPHHELPRALGVPSFGTPLAGSADYFSVAHFRSPRRYGTKNAYSFPQTDDYSTNVDSRLLVSQGLMDPLLLPTTRAGLRLGF
jgi:hypothetical protein